MKSKKIPRKNSYIIVTLLAVIFISVIGKNFLELRSKNLQKDSSPIQHLVSNGSRFVHNSLGISIVIPAGWEILSTDNLETPELSITNTVSGGPKGSIRINKLVKRLENGQNLVDFVENDFINNSNSADRTIHEKMPASIASTRGYLVEFSGPQDLKNSDPNNHYTALWLQHDEHDEIVYSILMSNPEFLTTSEGLSLLDSIDFVGPINNGDFIWDGGRFTDTNMRVSFNIPKGWSINPLDDPKNPGLQIFSNNQALTKGKPTESDRVEKIEILRSKKTDSSNDTSSDSSEVILSESTIQLNNKYTAKRTDVSSTWSGFKKDITYLKIEYKDQIIGFAIYDTEFFNRPETQALFDSIEISD